jgi:serine/threonine protein kinase
MGSVYLARAPDERWVALKLVKPAIAQDVDLRKRFLRESQAAGRVAHPHLVPVLDSGEHDGVLFLVSAYVAGGTLEDRLRSPNVLELEAAVGITLQVAAALDALHLAGLVHRDVKPANILLDGDACAYLGDLGLVKERDATVLTRPGQALGTVDYMAPEQIRGQEVSERTDVYALGCVVCELVYGRVPFAERQGMHRMWGHLQEQPQEPTGPPPDLPPRMWGVIARALEKVPEDRPPSATAYAQMVQLAAGG